MLLLKRKNKRPLSNCESNNGNDHQSLRLDLGPVLHEAVDGKRIESRHYSAENVGKLIWNKRNAAIHLCKERRKIGLDNQDNHQAKNNSQNGNNIRALNSMPNNTLRNILTTVDYIRNESSDKMTVSNSAVSNVSLNEESLNRTSTASDQVNEYLTSARNKALVVKAFTSQVPKTETPDFTFTNISIYSQNCISYKILLTKHEMLHGCKLGIDSHADVSCIRKYGCCFLAPPSLPHQ